MDGRVDGPTGTLDLLVVIVSLVGTPAFVALREGGGLLWLQYELAVPLAMAGLVWAGAAVLRRAPGADVVSDVLQRVLLWGGTGIAAAVLVARHGAGRLLREVSPDRLVPLDLSGHGLGDGITFGLLPMLVGGTFLYLSYYGCDQTPWQRILAARSTADARRALTMAAFVRFPLVATYCLFGLLLAGFLALEPGFAAAIAG